MRQATVQSPFGPLTLTEGEGVLTGLSWHGGGAERSDLLDAATRQLTEYFNGTRAAFDLPLALGSWP